LLLPSCAVFDELTAEFESLAAPCTATVIQDASLYTSPFDYGPEDHVITTIAAGQSLVVTAYNEYDWYQSADGWLWLDDGWTLRGSCTVLPQDGGYSLPDPHQCYYFQYGIAAPHTAYTDPRIGEPEQITFLENLFYPVIARSEIWYEIVLDGGEQTGWVRDGTGDLHGDCASLPLERMRPVPPEGICTLYIEPNDEQDYALYSFPDTDSQIVAVMPEGEYVRVEAYTGDEGYYRLRLAGRATGWLMEPYEVLRGNRALNGPCDALPVEANDIPMG
jgi:hypothetical protein